MPENNLTPISRSDVTKLRDLYLADWPRNCVGYYTLNNYINWLEKDPEIKNLSLLTLNDDWSDGTYLLIHRYQVFPNSLASSNERLITALSLLDWSRGFKVSALLQRHRPAVNSILESKQLKIECDIFTYVYHLPQEEAIQFKNFCPDGMVLKKLSETQADDLNSQWPNKHRGSLFLLKLLLRLNLNVGLYFKDTDELVAWCLRAQGGFLSVFQVKECYRRRQLGGVILKAISKVHAENGQDVMACVMDFNEPSKKIFNRCGFKVIDQAYWLRTYPTIDFTWPEGE